MHDVHIVALEEQVPRQGSQYNVNKLVIGQFLIVLMNSDILPTGQKKSFWQRLFVSKRNERDDTEENSPLLPKKEVSHGTTNT